ncbi:MAG: hypothetical protein DRJ03_01285 [Chloroflexi bacterium]|nr:MAG: hypothetical protein DRJ03_01285 [Chloroflexota bacterium]
MALNKVYVGDVGTDIILDTGVDLSAATTLKIKYKKPGGEIEEWDGTLEDTTKIKYTTVTDDLDTAGLWSFQAYVELPAWQGHGELAQYNIFELME